MAEGFVMVSSLALPAALAMNDLVRVWIALSF